MVYIHKRTGTHFIGNKIEQLKSDEMILLGADLPHLFLCDNKYYKNERKLKAEASVIHFIPSFLGNVFYNLPENELLVKPLDKAKQGTKITDKTKNMAGSLMKRLYAAAGTERLSLLLIILHCIVVSKGNKPIPTKTFDFSWDETENNRLNGIYQYFLTKFSKKITLKQIASVANLPPPHFAGILNQEQKNLFGFSTGSTGPQCLQTAQ